MKSVELLVPKLGMDTTEATITSWMIAEGESIQVGTSLVELETEKVNFVVESEVTGMLAKIVEPEGAVVPVGGVIAILEAE
jgi:pyruvate/2-oxoglutarate dehydrogenase complex dihydrolipoamide acyltransferase (E2) component